MKRILQLKWTDETEWKFLRVLNPDDRAEDVLAEEREKDRQLSLKYPHHKHHAEFRITVGLEAHEILAQALP